MAASSSNAGLGALDALRGDPDESRSPDRWLTCNMEYGRFYRLPRLDKTLPKRTEKLEKQPQKSPPLNLDILHDKCEKKWEELAKQLEECRNQVEQLRLQKSGDRSPRSRQGSPRGSPRGSPPRGPVSSCQFSTVGTATSNADHDDSPVTTYRCESGSSSGEHRHEFVISTDRKQQGTPRRIFKICISRTPSEDDDDMCDRCKMLQRGEVLDSASGSPQPSPQLSPRSSPSSSPKRSKKRWHKKNESSAATSTAPSDSSIHPATFKYNYYKYYGFGGHGAKTSWAHNLPLGLAPPYGVKVPIP